MSKKSKHITKISATHHGGQSAIKAKEASKASEADKAVKHSEAAKRNETPNTAENAITRVQAKAKPSKKQRKAEKLAKKAEQKALKHSKLPNDDQNEKPLKEVFWLARPFVGIGRYLRDSWRELRQVRWPSRKATWKMTLAVLVYCAIFMVFILLLDTLFTFIFNLLISK